MTWSSNFFYNSHCGQIHDVGLKTISKLKDLVTLNLTGMLHKKREKTNMT